LRQVVAVVFILLAGILEFGSAFAQNPSTLSNKFHDYFKAVALKAGQGARNEVVRQRYIEAALAPLLTNSLIEQPGQIRKIIAGLSAAVPDAAPKLILNATASFPGFSREIAQASAIRANQPALPTAAMTQSFQVVSQDLTMGTHIKGGAILTASWAVSAISRNPAGLEQILEKALVASAGHENIIIRSVQSAYPGFSRRIGAAIGITSINYRETSLSASPEQLAVQTVEAQIPGHIPTGSPLHPSSTLTADQYQANVNNDGDEISDPVEPVNRIFFSFNESIDFLMFRPIAQGYNYVMPVPTINAIRRFFLNLDSPVILANDLVQGDFKQASITLGRFGINSSLGMLGFLDPAKNFGWERHHADFGQTLYSYGVGSGPYLVLPLIGPASMRGSIGRLVDILFQPLSYFLTTGQNFGISGSRAVVKREELLRPLQELRENSVDYYTALKAAFWQARQIELGKSVVDSMGNGGADKLFDAAD